MPQFFSTINLVLILSLIIVWLLVIRERHTLAVFRVKDRWR
jgi:hypothetical protein